VKIGAPGQGHTASRTEIYYSQQFTGWISPAASIGRQEKETRIGDQDLIALGRKDYVEPIAAA
jgi:hypothetical protein